MSTPDEPEGTVPDVDPIDELASALVDGEATEAERARAADPEVAARVAAFEAVARRVGAPVTPPNDAERDAAIAAALAAAADVPSPSPSPAPTAVRSLDEARDRRRRGVPAWLARAAAVLVVLGGLGLLVATIGTGGDDADTAASGGDAGVESAEERAESAADEDSSATTAAGSGGDGSGGAAEAPASTTIEAATRHLGEFDSANALLDVARDAAALSTAGSADQEISFQELDACRAEESAQGASVTATATATLRGREVLVLVLTEAGGDQVVLVLDASSCDRLASADL